MGTLREPELLKLEVCPLKNQFCRLKAQPAHYQEYAIIALVWVRTVIL